MEQNKTGKYFKYAIGEIVLVVIGILIALSINNWNEITKNRTEEVRLLEKVSTDLISDINQLKKHISDATQRQTKVDSIFTILYKDSNTDPIKFLKLNFDAISIENHFEVNSSTFDESQAAGSIKFIQNDSLREDIFNYYRITKRNYDDENTVQSIYRDIYPIMFKKILASKEFVLLYSKIESTLPGLNIKSLGKDQDYMSILLHKGISEKVQIGVWKSFRDKAELLIQHIQSNQNKEAPN
jgi:phosphoenolpyruvate synthase/pyruvate phosphate dikinase